MSGAPRIRPGIRVSVLAVAIAVAAVALAPGTGVFASEPPPDATRRDAALQDDAAQRLAEKYAPIVYLREQSGECDREGQVYEPRPVEMIFGQAGIALKDDSGNVVADTVDAADLYQKDDGYYIDLPGSPQSPGCTYETDYRRLREGQPVVAYAHIARQEDHDGFALQYWFYYYFDDWNNKHESDWEMVQLIFDVATPEEALGAAPVKTGYSQHSGGESAEWDSDKVRKDGDRPHVYVATGAQSNFYRDRTYLGRAEQGAGFGCDVASGPSRAVPVDARVVPETVAGADDPDAWLTFEGRWGQRHSGEFNGPTGPNTKRAWDEPFAWQDDLRETSVEVPISRDVAVGVNVANLFCDVVSYASNNLLIAWMTTPWAVLGIGAVVLGAAGLTFGRTRYRPAIPEPLRQRRYLGQIMITATRIYLRHPLTLLAIGLLFIPAGLISGALQIMVASLPFTGPISDILSRNPVSALAVTIGIGAFFVLIAYGLVMAGVAWMMDDLEHGMRVRARDVYGALWHTLPALFVTRLRASVRITLLGVTIVGLPWAIRWLVQWAFAEWSVMVLQLRGKPALGASARLVDGQWWRTLGVGAVLVAIGLGLAPVVGLALLLFSDLPVTTVNVVSSLMFLALVPWTAVATTLLWYDLQARRDDKPR
jgi:hypothetical protein